MNPWTTVKVAPDPRGTYTYRMRRVPGRDDVMLRLAIYRDKYGRSKSRMVSELVRKNPDSNSLMLLGVISGIAGLGAMAVYGGKHVDLGGFSLVVPALPSLSRVVFTTPGSNMGTTFSNAVRDETQGTLSGFGMKGEGIFSFGPHIDLKAGSYRVVWYGYAEGALETLNIKDPPRVTYATHNIGVDVVVSLTNDINDSYVIASKLFYLDPGLSTVVKSYRNIASFDFRLYADIHLFQARLAIYDELLGITLKRFTIYKVPDFLMDF